MEHILLFYKLFLIDGNGKPTTFLGNAFPIAPHGTMMTCRHVVDVKRAGDARLAIFDNETRRFVVINEPPIICQNPMTDMAVLPFALGRKKDEFFPILPGPVLTIGSSVYTPGYFAIGGSAASIEIGYFAGKIVSVFDVDEARTAKLTLPYPVLEGLSGAPVLIYHNGPKVAGMGIGNRITRILAAETFEYKDDRMEFKETINRIVEFGTAMHCAAIVEFIKELECGVQLSPTNVSMCRR